MTLWRAFEEDPLLAIVFSALVIAAWVALSATPLLPFVDLHNSVGAASMMFHAAIGRKPIADHYALNWALVPYWTGYLLMAVADAFGGTLFAAKAICALLVALIPLSVMRLLIALKRSPRQCLWAFVLTWDHNLYFGFVTFLLGVALVFFAVAWLLEVEGWRPALRVTAVSTLVGLTHPQALAWLAVAGLFVTVGMGPTWRRLRLNALALSGGLVAALPWMYKVLFPADPVVASTPLTFQTHTMAQKAQRLFEYSLNNFNGEFDTGLPVVAFFAVLFAPALLASVRRTLPRGRSAAAVAFALSGVVLYLVLPFGVEGPIQHLYNYERFATISLLALIAVPRPRLTGAAVLTLVPAIVLAIAMDMHVARQFKDFGSRVRPLLRIIPAVRRGSSILPVTIQMSDPACKLWPLGQLHAYVAGESDGFDPYFFDNPSVPLVFRKENMLPRPSWRYPEKLNFDNHVRPYDYVLVQGLARDPFAAGGHLNGVPVKLVTTSGMWRLYAVLH